MSHPHQGPRTPIWIPLVALLLALSPLVVVYPVSIQGSSMEPTLRAGELRWAWRAWVAGKPQRGQVWVVDSPSGPVCKRLLGLPGESLVLRSGTLWVQDRPYPEPYLQRPEMGSDGPWHARDGYLFFGDNRPLSQDSRTWGPLPPTHLRGRLLGQP